VGHERLPNGSPQRRVVDGHDNVLSSRARGERLQNGTVDFLVMRLRENRAPDEEDDGGGKGKSYATIGNHAKSRAISPPEAEPDSCHMHNMFILNALRYLKRLQTTLYDNTSVFNIRTLSC